MPILKNARHEAFAQARARGARLDDAYEDAGFAPGRGHASRLAGQDKVAERIAELRALDTQMEGAEVQTVIVALLRLAGASEAEKNLAGLKEARQTLLEACRLRNELTEARNNERIQLHGFF